MTKDEFVARVLSILVFPPNVPTEDVKSVKRCLKVLHDEKFTVSEAFQYVYCLEEVNPLLDEDQALARMKKIRDGVNNTLSLRTKK